MQENKLFPTMIQVIIVSFKFPFVHFYYNSLLLV